MSLQERLAQALRDKDATAMAIKAEIEAGLEESLSLLLFLLVSLPICTVYLIMWPNSVRWEQR